MIASIATGSIGFDDVGSGLPVVFLHGFPHDRTLWAPQLGALATPARTIAVDLRGFGESTGPRVSSLDDYVDDVIALLEARHLGPAVIAGLSMGGYIALALWRRAPARVRALVLTDTKASADDDATRARRAEQIQLVESRGTAVLADQLLPGMLGKSTRAANPDLVEHVHAMLAAVPVDAVTGALRAMGARPDASPTLGAITVPTLVVVGEEDVLTPVADAQRMHGGINGSRLEIIPAAGHLASLERPAAYNHVLSEFLASLTYQ